MTKDFFYYSTKLKKYFYYDQEHIYNHSINFLPNFNENRYNQYIYINTRNNFLNNSSIEQLNKLFKEYLNKKDFYKNNTIQNYSDSHFKLFVNFIEESVDNNFFISNEIKKENFVRTEKEFFLMSLNKIKSLNLINDKEYNDSVEFLKDFKHNEKFPFFKLSNNRYSFSYEKLKKLINDDYDFDNLNKICLSVQEKRDKMNNILKIIKKHKHQLNFQIFDLNLNYYFLTNIQTYDFSLEENIYYNHVVGQEQKIKLNSTLDNLISIKNVLNYFKDKENQENFKNNIIDKTEEFTDSKSYAIYIKKMGQEGFISKNQRISAISNATLFNNIENAKKSAISLNILNDATIVEVSVSFKKITEINNVNGDLLNHLITQKEKADLLESINRNKNEELIKQLEEYKKYFKENNIDYPINIEKSNILPKKTKKI